MQYDWKNYACFVPISLKVGLKFSSHDLKFSFSLNLACLCLRAWSFKEIQRFCDTWYTEVHIFSNAAMVPRPVDKNLLT